MQLPCDSLSPRFAFFRFAVTIKEGCGAVAQLGERLVRNEEASGSIPLSSTKDSMTAAPNGRGLFCSLSGCLILVVWMRLYT